MITFFITFGDIIWLDDTFGGIIWPDDHIGAIKVSGWMTNLFYICLVVVIGVIVRLGHNLLLNIWCHLFWLMITFLCCRQMITSMSSSSKIIKPIFSGWRITFSSTLVLSFGSMITFGVCLSIVWLDNILMLSYGG
jgi:hypothetical protein